jgi:hypothetical protein
LSGIWAGLDNFEIQISNILVAMWSLAGPVCLLAEVMGI